VRASGFSSAGRAWPGTACGRLLAAALVLLFGVAGSRAGEAQSAPVLAPAVRHAMERITGKEIIAHARVLSDAKFRGREASNPGARKAAAYIAGQFRTAGLRPGGSAGGYDQVFKIRVGYEVAAELTLRLGESSLGELKRGADYALVHLPGGKAEVNAACVLAGYGITAPGSRFDEYAALDADHNTPRDTWDKLLPAKVEKVARLAFLTALEVAERQSRPRFKQPTQDDPLMLLQGAVR